MSQGVAGLSIPTFNGQPQRNQAHGPVLAAQLAV